ncbi:ABC transporter ATP-binding protein [Rheinheimera sp.]|uniref:ABC transporter ATP-binding protein n=1 Tax=Rheinheimera sp. TaxID=1869214 RepID=UPI00307F80C9
MALVRFKQVRLELQQQPVLHSLSFELQEQQFVGLIGPNGAGKTSLQRLLQAEYQPSSGQIELDQIPLNHYSRPQLARQLAVVSQLPGHLFDLSVLDVVTMGLLPHKKLWQTTTADDQLLVLQQLEQVGLLSRQQQPFASLSGGEQQRALLARALVQRPRLLLLDEPTNHLDPYYQHQMMHLCKTLGIAVLASIHDLNLAACYCDRLLLLDQGHLLADGPVGQVLTEPLLQQVFRSHCLVDQNPFVARPRVNFGHPEWQ